MVLKSKRNLPANHPFSIRGRPGREYLKRQLRLLFDFLHQDIRSMDSVSFVEALHRVSVFLYLEQVSEEREIGEICIDTPRNREAVIKIQNLMTSYLEGVLSGNEQARQDGWRYLVEDFNAQYEVVVEKNRVSIRLTNRLFPFRKGKLSGSHEPIPINSGFMADDDFVKRYFLENPRIDAEKYALFAFCYDPDIRTSVRQRFISLLEHFNLDSIARCSRCDLYYLKTKNKRKPLCKGCANFENVNKWRRKNPEVYKTYQRNLKKGLKQTVSQIRKELKNKGGRV